MTTPSTVHRPATCRVRDHKTMRKHREKLTKTPVAAIRQGAPATAGGDDGVFFPSGRTICMANVATRGGPCRMKRAIIGSFAVAFTAALATTPGCGGLFGESTFEPHDDASDGGGGPSLDLDKTTHPGGGGVGCVNNGA